jgi:CDP-glycerol glycerophosphotransferase
MKTSIIIAYDKGEVYLRDCLDSLVEQSGQEMEILLICDHVNNKDLNFIKQYESELSIHIYHLQEKTGVAAARNLGLEKATGDYVYFLDSDDYLYGSTIEDLVHAAQEKDDDIVYGKKNPTWFGRSIFLARELEQETGDVEEESEGSTGDSAELQTENGGEVEKDNSVEDGSEEDNSDDNTLEEDSEETREEKEKKRDRKASEIFNKLSSLDGEATGRDLTEEELSQLKEISVKQAYRVLVSKRKGVRNISVLNILFKRSFLEDNNIRFPEDFIYLSDVPFLLEALSKTDKFKKRFTARYIKRKHNDSINFPSLSQIRDPNRFYEFLDLYNETTRRIPKDSELKDQFDKKYYSNERDYKRYEFRGTSLLKGL